MAATLPRKNRTNHNPQNLPHIWWQRFYGLTIFYSAHDHATSDSSDDSLQQLSVWKVSGGPLCCTFCCIVLCNYFLLSDCIYCDSIFFLCQLCHSYSLFMSESKFVASASDTSFAPRKSRRQPTCEKEHFLRGTQTMSSEGSEAPRSPTPSSVPTVGNADVCSLLQMMAAQNARQEELRLRQEELRMEHDKIQTAQRLDHELKMAQFQATMLQAQTDSVRDMAEAATAARQREAEEAETARCLDLESAERLRLKEAELRMAQMREMEEKQAAVLLRRADEDRTAKVEAAIRHVKRDTPKMQAKDFPTTYMASFERMVHNQGIPQEEWASCFLFCLTGGDSTIWATLLDSAPDTSYMALKPQFLSRVGHDWATNASFLAFKKKPFTLSYEQYLHESVLWVRQIVLGAKDVMEAVD